MRYDVVLPAGGWRLVLGCSVEHVGDWWLIAPQDTYFWMAWRKGVTVHGQ
jgi:hypothetical protein